MKIIWTDGAVEDLQQAVDFLNRSSEEAGGRLAEAVISRVDGLQSMPDRSRKRQSDTAFEAPVLPWPYVVIYEIHHDAIHIEGIMHTARDRAR